MPKIRRYWTPGRSQVLGQLGINSARPVTALRVVIRSTYHSELLMIRTMRAAALLAVIVSLWATLLCSPSAAVPTVWSGLDISFVKPNDFHPSLPESQDRITDNVWLTRDVQQGIFNIQLETEFNDVTFTSPAGTEWATDLNNNTGTSISATNWENLSFTTWVAAYGGQPNVGHNIVGREAVLHLIADDVYLDIMFTQWTQSAGGGGFSYFRADGDLPDPTPDPTGDYNGNGVVDAADYTNWRDTLGATVSPGEGADGDESGTIDAGDYTFWKARFGDTVPGSGAGLASAAVPEPTTIAFPFTFLVLGPFARRWRLRT